jgi:hypothetical protein
MAHSRRRVLCVERKVLARMGVQRWFRGRKRKNGLKVEGVVGK